MESLGLPKYPFFFSLRTKIMKTQRGGKSVEVVRLLQIAPQGGPSVSTNAVSANSAF
jgi:hypothetical protein